MSDIERGGPSHGISDSNVVKSPTQSSEDVEKNRLELYKAALNNDWKKAETIYNNAKMKYGERITLRGETALHVAALAGHLEFVQNLVQMMDSEEIAIQSGFGKPGEENNMFLKGNTAFHCAVLSGNIEIAEAILRHGGHDLLITRGAGNNLPIHMAAAKGNEEIVRFLYDSHYRDDVKADRFNHDHVIFLFLSLIKSKIYGVALLMAEELLSQKRAPEQLEEDGLQELAQIPLNPPGLLHRCLHLFSCRQEVVTHRKVVKLVKLLWNSLTENEERVFAFINSPNPNPIIEAAKRGNFHFLSILISIYPDALFTCDHNNYSIIHHAILNRRVDIFKFIHLSPARSVVTMFRDRGWKNMLHLAAMLAPPDRLNIVPGAALQLQREMLWFEEVKKVMEPHQVDQIIYYASEFPLEKMSTLIQEMAEAIDNIVYIQGIFEVLQRHGISVYRPTHQIIYAEE